MLKDIAITVIGPDRTGIVSELSQVIASHEANWLDSHMAILAGQFAGIVHVSVPSNKADALRAELQALEKSALHIAIAEGTPAVNKPNRRQVQLELTGLDHAGIVRDITQALFDVGVSVAEFESQQYDGSMSGEKMFRAKATLAVPEDLALDSLDAAIQGVSESLMADIVLEDI